MKTRSIKKDEIQEKWYLVDVANVRLGRAAQAISKLLLGKSDVGRADYLAPKNKVVVINSDKVDYFFSREWRKKYYSHSGYPGALKETTLGELMKKDSTEVVRKAVWGMVPKTKIGRGLMSNISIYKGAEYKETAQKPELIEVK